MEIGRISSGYKFDGLLGKGAFGEVFSASKSGNKYAIKMMEEKFRNSEAEINFADHLSIRVNSPFVVRYLDRFRDASIPGKVFVVMELCDMGDLQKVVSQIKKGVPITADRVWKIFIQITLGLYALHYNKIIHRGIKAENIFIDSEDNCKIGDMGESRELEATDGDANTFLGTPLYMAPEQFKNERYGCAVDIWSLGVLMYLLCTTEHPFKSESMAKIASTVIAGKYKPIPADLYPEGLRHAISSLLIVNPRERPSALDILRNPLVRVFAVKCGLSANYPREAATPAPSPTSTPSPSPVKLSLDRHYPHEAAAPAPTPAPTPTSTPTSASALTPAPVPGGIDADVAEFIRAAAENNPAVAYTVAQFRTDFQETLDRKPNVAEVTLFLKSQKDSRSYGEETGGSMWYI